MRAKIASRAKGHALEKRFLDLDEAQLYVLYRQVLEEENQERQEKFDWFRTMNDLWTENFNVWFNELKFFVNRELYLRAQELKELDIHRQDVSVEEFPEMWAKMMETIPQTYVVEDVVQHRSELPKVDDQMEEVIAGWVQFSKSMRNEGDG